MKHAIAPGPFAPATGAGPDKNTQRSAGRHILANPLVLTWAGLMQLGCNLALAQSHGVPQVELAIDPAPLDEALVVWARKTGYQVLMSPDQMAGEGTSPRLRGTYTPEAALEVLLSRSDLGYRFVNSNTVAISSQITDSDRLLVRGRSPGVSAPSMATSTSAVDMDGGNDVGGDAGGGSEAEIIVSAQKRDERLQDVPVPVTAISANSLVESNQLKIQDYYASVPGLNLTTDARGNALLSIRGVTTGANVGNPTVGITVDDVPFGSSSTYGSVGGPVPDIDPSDLARVEVLRGPQGTLYGASSIGGLLKFVTLDPSTAGLSGHIQAGTSSIHNGSGLSYSVRGSANVPVTDSIAFRASAFKRIDAGYIDDPALNLKGVNRVSADGGHLSALWRVSDVFSVKFGALIQDVRANGSPYVMPSVGDLQHTDLIGSGGYDEKTGVYSLTFLAKLGAVDLTAVSGYSTLRLSDNQDQTAYYGSFTQDQFGAGGSPLVNHTKTNKFSQEIRATSRVGESLDWLVGAFYTHEDSNAHQQILAVDPATGATAGQFLDATWPTSFAEYAAFADLTYHFTDRLNLQVGARDSHNRQTYSEVDAGPFAGSFELGDPTISPEVETKDQSITYLVTPQFKITPDMMVYARFASGYRPGGPNPTCAAFNVPCHFEPDKTRDYDVGFKGDFLEQKFSFDLSFYYIDWKNIQLYELAPCNCAALYTNAAGAKSQGFEVSINTKPWSGLTVGGWFAFNDAKLTQDLPPASLVTGLSGDRLPNSSRVSGNVSIEQAFRFGRGWSGYGGGSVVYVGDRKGNYTATSDRQDLPGYAEIDLRAGIRYDSWDTNLYVNNVADRRGLLSGGLDAVNPPLRFNYIQPRTVGIMLSKSF